ncbi:MAG: efflux RND transporter periplasmic adaptor subunit [Rhodomicrobium sp.]
MSQHKASKGGKQPEPFDGFDDVAEGITKPHSHPAIPMSSARGTGRRLAVSALLLALGLGGAYFYVNTIKAKDQAELAAATAAKVKEPPTVEVVTVTQAPPRQSLRLPGGTEGWYQSKIYGRVSGYITKWFADIGDRVKKDQALAIIDTPELDAQLEAGRAQLKASEAEVTVREADADFAKTTFDRWQGSAKGVVSDQERDEKRASYSVAMAKVKAAQAKVNLDKSNVDRLTFMTQFKKVSAPYDGVITERRIDVGDLVTAGSTSNTTPLFGIAQFDQIRVFSNVPQRAAGDTTVGTPAKVFTPDDASQAFEGKVARTSESIDPKARTLKVEVDLPNPQLKLVPGMYVQVEFNAVSRALVQIPAGALLFRSGGPQVAVTQPDSTIKFKDVQIGRDNGNTVEIESGLADGDRVALNINNQIEDGSKVIVKENNKVAVK